MLFNFKDKIEIKRTSYHIAENTQIYYPTKTKKGKLYSDPKCGEYINYTPKGLPRNCFEKYYNYETGISIIIFTMGNKLYIRPEMSYIYPELFINIETKLKRLGFKETNMDTPFSKGYIPSSKEWNDYYKRIKANAYDQYRSIILEEQDDLL